MSATIDELLKVAEEIKALTGDDFYLYTSQPGDGQTRVVFQDGIQQGYSAGLTHARDRLVWLERLADAGVDVHRIGEQGFRLAREKWQAARER